MDIISLRLWVKTSSPPSSSPCQAFCNSNQESSHYHFGSSSPPSEENTEGQSVSWWQQRTQTVPHFLVDGKGQAQREEARDETSPRTHPSALLPLARSPPPAFSLWAHRGSSQADLSWTSLSVQPSILCWKELRDYALCLPGDLKDHSPEDNVTLSIPTRDFGCETGKASCNVDFAIPRALVFHHGVQTPGEQTLFKLLFVYSIWNYQLWRILIFPWDSESD